MTLKNKLSSEEFLRKHIAKELPNLWHKLDATNQDKIIDKFSDTFAAELDEVETTLQKTHQQTREAHSFLFGVLVGIVGGFVANIIHDYLKQFGVFYTVPAIIVLSVLIAYFWVRTRKSISVQYRNNPLLSKLLDTLRKEREIGH